MTLQVALVGTDGIVLASDKLTVVSGNDLFRHSFLMSKILIDSTERIAIAHSGYGISRTVAETILSDPSPVKEKLSKIKLQSFASDVCEQQEWRPLGWHGELIIVSLDDLDHVLHLKMTDLVLDRRIAGVRAELNRIEDKIREGDPSNPAGFFVESYYRKQPIAQLLFLAAHVIVSGSRLNPAGIEGLEVIKCTSKGFERLPEASVAELIERSDELDNRIKSEIFKGAGKAGPRDAI